MPNIITHVLFARELEDEKLSDDLKKRIEARQQLYEIGANGADYLFFHGVNPKRILEKSTLRVLGQYVHRRGINDFYTEALDVIRHEKESDVKEDEIVYIMGHLTHWALDSTSHPYIFWRTGSGSSDASIRHHKFESILDAVMLKVKKEQTIKDFKAYKICEISIDDVRSISRLYTHIAKAVYGVEIKPHQVLEALNDWYRCQKALYDATGKKKKAFLKVENAIHTPGLVSAMFVPKDPTDPVDVCNLKHREWCHPCDDEKTSTESFFDLYDRAMKEAQQAITLFIAAVDDPSKEQEFIDFLDNRNYTKGLSDNPPMKYFDDDLKQTGEMLIQEQK